MIAWKIPPAAREGLNRFLGPIRIPSGAKRPRSFCGTYGGIEVPPYQDKDLIRGSLV